VTKSSVSAIVSAYFAEKYITARLENLQQQSAPPEIVVVCQDRSPEHELTLDFMRHTPKARVTMVSTPDVPTIYEAWNLAVSVAQGEFLTSANCDDHLRPTALEVMARELKRHSKYAVVYGNQEIVERLDGPVVGTYDWLEGGLTELLQGCFVGPMPMWRKSLHTQYGLFDPGLYIAGDYEFWLRIASHGERFLHIRGIVGTYLKRSDSAEHRESLRTVWETAQVRTRYRKEVQ